MKLTHGVSTNATEGRRTVRSEDRVEYRILARKLKKLRTKAKLSGSQLSLKLGKVRGYISKIENGSHYPDFATILDIIKITGGDPAEVVAQVVAESEHKA